MYPTVSRLLDATAKTTLGQTKVAKLVASPSSPIHTFHTMDETIRSHFALLILSAIRPDNRRHRANGTRNTGPDRIPYSAKEVPVSLSIVDVDAT
jgi:hypothetical protein